MATDEVAEQIAAKRPADNSDGSVIDPALAGVRIGGAGGGEDCARQGNTGEHGDATHEKSPTSDGLESDRERQEAVIVPAAHRPGALARTPNYRHGT
jgi:hypothetical protein